MSGVRTALRFVAAVLMVSGALLILDATTTLLWQEPISWGIAQTRQADLERELAVSRATAKAISRRPRLAWPTASSADTPLGGSRCRRCVAASSWSRASAPRRCARDPATTPTRRCPVSGGRSPSRATARPTSPPSARSIGCGAASRSSSRCLPYGRFVYRVEKQMIVPPTATEVTRRVGHDRLVLTACHPLYSAAQRIVVFGRLQRAKPV
jgi:sortase A